MISRKIQTILILSTLMLSTFFGFPILPKAHATTPSCTGTIANCVFVDPATMALAATGSTVTFNVKVANMDRFNAFDISVQTDFNSLSGLSITFPPPAGTGVPGLGGTVTVHAKCVEGQGSNCNINDGQGVNHLAVSYSQNSTGSGTLFQINYQAINSDPGSSLCIVNTVVAYSGTQVPIATACAVYATPTPDFTASASSPVDQNGNPVFPGSEGQSVVSLTSVGGFTDTLDISLGAITGGPNSISDSVSPASVSLPAGGSASATISVTVPLSTTPGTYHQAVTIKGESTGTTHMVDLVIVVAPPPSAGLTCGTDLSVVQDTTGANPVHITSQNGLFGGVFLSTATASGSGLTATTDPESVTMGAGGSQNAVLYVAADRTAPLGTSMVNVTADFGTGSTLCSINVTVLAFGSPDFTLSSSDSSIIAIRGTTIGNCAISCTKFPVTYNSTITVTSVAGFDTSSVSTSRVLIPTVANSATVTVSQPVSGTATLTFKTVKGTEQLLTYKAIVIGGSGSQRHAVAVSYRLEDFGIQARGAGNFPEYVLTATECNVGKLSFGSLNGFTGILKISRFRVFNLTAGGIGFPTGVSFSFNNTSFSNSDASRINPADNKNGLFTADGTANHILGVKINVTSGSFVAGPLKLCTTTDTPGGEYQLQIRATVTVNGVAIPHVKNIFVQINSFDIAPSNSFVVARGTHTTSVPVSVVGAFEEDLCCSMGFGTFPFLDFVSLSASITATMTPDPAKPPPTLIVTIAPGPYFTTDLINPTALLNVTVTMPGQGGTFQVTVTGVAQQTPALTRSATITVQVPSPLIQLPSLTATASPGLVTLKATISNTGTVPLFVQVVCSVFSLTAFYSPQSAIVMVAAGGRTTVTFTQPTTPADAGHKFHVVCTAVFGTSSSPDALIFLSKDKAKAKLVAQ